MYRVDQLSGFLGHIFIFKIAWIAAEIFFMPQKGCFGFAKSSVHLGQSDFYAHLGSCRPSAAEINPILAQKNFHNFIPSFRIPQNGLTRAARAGDLTPWRESRSSRPPTASVALTGSQSSSLQLLAAWGDVWVARREVPRGGGELGRS